MVRNWLWLAFMAACVYVFLYLILAWLEWLVPSYRYAPPTEIAEKASVTWYADDWTASERLYVFWHLGE